MRTGIFFFFLKNIMKRWKQQERGKEEIRYWTNWLKFRTRLKGADNIVCEWPYVLYVGTTIFHLLMPWSFSQTSTSELTAFFFLTFFFFFPRFNYNFLSLTTFWNATISTFKQFVCKMLFYVKKRKDWQIETKQGIIINILLHYCGSLHMPQIKHFQSSPTSTENLPTK